MKINYVLVEQAIKASIFVINLITNAQINASLIRGVKENAIWSMLTAKILLTIAIKVIDATKIAIFVKGYAKKVFLMIMRNIYVKMTTDVKKSVFFATIYAPHCIMIMTRKPKLSRSNKKMKTQEWKKLWKENFTFVIENIILVKGLVVKKGFVRLNIRINRKNGVKMEYKGIIYILNKFKWSKNADKK